MGQTIAFRGLSSAAFWSVTSSQVVYFQHPLRDKTLRRGKPARRLAAEVTDCPIQPQLVAPLVCDFQVKSFIFNHPLPPKKLRRGKPARRLAARSHRLFNPASAGGQADLRDSSPSPSTASPGILGEICKTRGTQGNPLGNKSEVFSFLALPCYPIIRFFASAGRK